MKQKIKKLAANRLVRGSAVLWVGTMAANVSNYLFHLLMGRFLGPVNYGVLASVISVLYILTVPTFTIMTAVMKFTAEHSVEEAPSKTRELMMRLSKRLLVISAMLFVVIVALSPMISSFLNISSIWPIVILSGIVLVGYVLSVNRGVLQGLQRFGSLSASLILETVIKLAVGVALVLTGFAVNGAVFGIVVAVFVAYLFSFWPLKDILAAKGKGGVSLRALFQYSLPVFITLLCLSAYYSVDIMLVKHFLPAVEAGYYSGLSILGKIVFFASLAITGVMFPMVAQRHKAEEPHRHILLSTLGLTTAVSGAIVGLYFIMPRFTISLLFGSKYLSVAPYLGSFGIAMLLLSLSYVLANYFLAIHKTRFVPVLVGVVVLQVGLLWFIHGSFTQIVAVMVGTMSLLFVSLVAYYLVAVGFKEGPEPEEPAAVPVVTEF
ncbi:MAG: oligosaccharide flippase family protein [Actinomycetota bacterium]